MPIVIGESPRPFPGLGYRVPLQDGEAGTAQTIDVMRKLVDDALADQNFVNFFGNVVRAERPFDEMGELRAIYDWFRRNIRFVRDPLTKEKLYPPTELLKIRFGDCDDVSMAIMAAITAIGFPGRWITISTNAENPREFTHIYTQAESPAGSGNWVTLDTARPHSQFGLEPEIYFRKRAWNFPDDSYHDLSGNRPRLPKFLSGYIGLGQDGGWSDINWQPVVQQSISEIPTIIAATSGHGTATSPYATYSSPYASYATAYTPGYGVPAAGYQTPTTPSLFGAGLTMSPTTLLLIVAGVLLFMHGRGSRR